MISGIKITLVKWLALIATVLFVVSFPVFVYRWILFDIKDNLSEFFLIMVLVSVVAIIPAQKICAKEVVNEGDGWFGVLVSLPIAIIFVFPVMLLLFSSIEKMLGISGEYIAVFIYSVLGVLGAKDLVSTTIEVFRYEEASKNT